MWVKCFEVLIELEFNLNIEILEWRQVAVFLISARLCAPRPDQRAGCLTIGLRNMGAVKLIL